LPLILDAADLGHWLEREGSRPCEAGTSDPGPGSGHLQSWRPIRSPVQAPFAFTQRQLANGLTTGVSDNNIVAGKWYTLTIDGNIVNGKVHYLDFIIHGTTHSLTRYSFGPTPEAGDGLVAAVQADGDAHADPYQLYLDNSHFYWK
jgi:hypothetical protein